MKTQFRTEKSAEFIKQYRRNNLKKNLVSYSFLLPVIIGILVFTLYPIVMSAIYAFSDFNGAFITKFGFFNFRSIFSFEIGDWGEAFFHSMKVTFLYELGSLAISLTLSYILALFLKSEIPGIRVIRVLCYLPCIIPGIAAGFIWTDAFAANVSDLSMNGLINTWIMNLGGKPLPFFSQGESSLPTLLFTGLWGLGGGMIMWLAAFGNISPDLYEAAKIDGAGYFSSLFRITLPMSTPILFYNAVTSMIGGLQIFGTYANYGAGVDDSLNFIVVRIYRIAFDSVSEPGGTQGLACAMSWILFLIIGLLTLLMFKLGGWVQYGEDT